MNSVAIISDLHLTENKYDEYRWKIWNWIRNNIELNSCDNLYILGDLLDKKDRHPAELVNRLVNEIAKTAKLVPVTILKGNHDYYKPEHPFIEFTQWLDGVRFISAPSGIGGKILWLPHSKNPEEEWKDLNFKDPKLKYIFMHQSVIGSQVSNYYEMKSGLSTTIFNNTPAKIISGDIHVPQDIPIVGAQPLTYVGTPYPIAFGDTYKPRGLLLKNDKLTSIYMDTIQKLHLKINEPKDLKKIKIFEEDQVKVTLQLSSIELSDWPKYKKEVQEYLQSIGAILRDIKLEKIAEETIKKDTNLKTNLRQESPNEILNRYSKQEKLDERILNAGLEIINEHTPASGLQQHNNKIIERQQRSKL